MLAHNIKEIYDRIARAASKRGSTPGEVTLVAVTKTVSIEQVKDAYTLGIKNFGENRLQEALPKVVALPEPCWHFVGHLQTNKIKQVIDHFQLIQSLDRFKLAAALQEEGERQGRSINALLQVNIGAEESKYGFAFDEIRDALAAIADYNKIRVRGLMAIAPFWENAEEIRPLFRRLYNIFSALKIPGVELKILSMGMTNDFEVAVEEGSNMVRIGTAIFGERAQVRGN